VPPVKQPQNSPDHTSKLTEEDFEILLKNSRKSKILGIQSLKACDFSPTLQQEAGSVDVLRQKRKDLSSDTTVFDFEMKA